MVHFQQLPVEIRLMIWYLIDEPRVVQINHDIKPSKKDLSHRARFVLESHPLSLQICRESRTAGLKIYDTLFSSVPQTWTYTGPSTSKALRAVCRYVGVPNYQGTKIDMERKLTSYVEQRQGEGSVLLKQLSKAPHSWGFVPVPQWFDVTSDTLMIRLRYPEPPNTSPQPTYSLQPSNLRNLTLIVRNFHWAAFIAPGMFPSGQSPLPAIPMEMNGAPWHFPQLQKLELVFTSVREIIRFEEDDAGLLKEGQWAYSLAASQYTIDAIDTTMKKNGKPKNTVLPLSCDLWIVTLGMAKGKSYQQLIAEWNVDLIRWDYHKRQIRYDERPDRYNHYAEKELLVGGDGKTYMGIAQSGSD